MKSLIGKSSCVFNFINDNELVIAIDVTHEPWNCIAVKLLTLLKEELDEVGYEIAEIDEAIAVVRDDGGKLQ